MRALITWIDRYSWLLLLLAMPFLLFPSPKRSLALLALPVIWMIGWLASGKPLPRTALNPALLLMALMILVSVWATYDLNISLGKICGVMLGMAIFFVIFQRGTTRRGWLVCMGLLLLCGAGIACVSLLGTQWVTGGKLPFLTAITAHLPVRLTGLAGAADGFHPNEVAGSLLWVLPLMITTSIGLLSSLVSSDPDKGGDKQLFMRLVLLVVVGTITVITLLVFVLTLSRTAYLALIIAMALLAWLILPRPWQIGLAVFAGMAVVILAVFLSTANVDTLNKVLFSSSTADSNPLNSMEGRLEIWMRAIECIQDFPYTGMGMNTFRTGVFIIHPPLLFNPETDIGHAHNEFLQAALDLGIPGCIAFIWLYISAFIVLFKAYRKAEKVDRQALPWILGLTGGLIAHLLFGMNDAVALGAKPGILYWMLLGLIVSLPGWLPNSPRSPSGM